MLENREALQQLIDDGPFNAKNVSSMLNGAGKDLGTAIEALIGNIGKLRALVVDPEKDYNQNIADGRLFEASNLSSILSGAGKNLGTGIETIHKHLPQLVALATIFRPSEIATQLNKRTVKQLGDAIDKMYKDNQEEIKDNTIIPAGAGPAIADSSLAAAAAKELPARG